MYPISHEHGSGEPDGAAASRLLACGYAEGGLRVELHEALDGSVTVDLADAEGDARRPLKSWPATDVEDGARRLVRLMRRRPASE